MLLAVRMRIGRRDAEREAERNSGDTFRPFSTESGLLLRGVKPPDLRLPFEAWQRSQWREEGNQSPSPPDQLSACPPAGRRVRSLRPRDHSCLSNAIENERERETEEKRKRKHSAAQRGVGCLRTDGRPSSSPLSLCMCERARLRGLSRRADHARASEHGHAVRVRPPALFNAQCPCCSGAARRARA